jgi:hypothetical protein
MPDSYLVSVRLRSGGDALHSPYYNSEDQAKSDLEAISKAQKDSEHIDLPWLSVDGTEVLAAQIIGRNRPRGG